MFLSGLRLGGVSGLVPNRRTVAGCLPAGPNPACEVRAEYTGFVPIATPLLSCEKQAWHSSMTFFVSARFCGT